MGDVQIGQLQAQKDNHLQTEHTDLSMCVCVCVCVCCGVTHLQLLLDVFGSGVMEQSSKDHEAAGALDGSHSNSAGICGATSCTGTNSREHKIAPHFRRHIIAQDSAAQEGLERGDRYTPH